MQYLREGKRKVGQRIVVLVSLGVGGASYVSLAFFYLCMNSEDDRGKGRALAPVGAGCRCYQGTQGARYKLKAGKRYNKARIKRMCKRDVYICLWKRKQKTKNY